VRAAIARRFDGATENAGFNAKIQRNLGLDFVTKKPGMIAKLEPFTA